MRLSFIKIVILILIISIIPSIFNYSNKKSYKLACINYLTKIEDDILARRLFSNLPFENGIYEVGTEIDADIYDERPDSGWIEIKKDVVTKCSLKYNKYIVNCINNSNNIKIRKGKLKNKPKIDNVYKFMTSVFYDPVYNHMCSKVDYNKGKSCYKFYILNIENNVDLILSKNIKDNVLYNNIEDELINATSTWNKDLNTRIMSYDELNYYLNKVDNINLDNNTTLSSKYTNLGDNLKNCNLYRCINDGTSVGYWIKSSVGEKVYNVRSDNGLKILLEYPSLTILGIRPIITIDKKLIDN